MFAFLVPDREFSFICWARSPNLYFEERHHYPHIAMFVEFSLKYIDYRFTYDI